MSHLYRRGKIYWRACYQGGKLVRKSLKTKNLSSARILQNEKDKELLQIGAAAPAQNNLCNIALDEYLSYRKHRGNKLANSKTEHEIRDFLEWGKIERFDQINEKKFQEYLNYRIEHDSLKEPTLDRYIASIKAWLNYCVRTHSIFHNPLTYVSKFDKAAGQGAPKIFLDKDEITKLLNASRDPDIYVDKKPVLFPSIATGIYTGMRPAELFHLEWQDIDFKRNQITIRNKAGFTTKTNKFRIVPLFSKLKAILLPLHKESGKCFDVTNKRRVFGRIVTKSEIKKNVDWYTLRHTFISHALMDGIPIRTVAAYVGHKRISTTMGYAHLSQDHSEGQIEKLTI